MASGGVPTPTPGGGFGLGLQRPRLIAIVGLVAILVAGAILAGAVALADDAPRPPRTTLQAAVANWFRSDFPAGLEADVRVTTHLVEAGGLADGSALLAGATAHAWLSADGRARVDVRTARGDATIAFDGRQLTIYDAPTNTVYRLEAPEALQAASGAARDGETPDAAGIALALAALATQVQISGPEPGTTAGQPSYTVRISPRRDAGLLGAVELAWDAARGVPLRVALYAADQDEPVLEAEVTEIAYGPVEERELTLRPPADAAVIDLAKRIEEVTAEAADHLDDPSVEGVEAVDAAVPFDLRAPDALVGLPSQGVRLVPWDDEPAALALYGRGLGQMLVLEQAAGTVAADELEVERLPRIAIDGANGWELATPLGTVLRVERDGVVYTLAGSVPAVAAEAAMRELLR